MAEHDREPVTRPVGDRTLGRVLDLDVQHGAVVGDHRDDPAAQPAERLVALRVRAQGTAHDDPLGRDADRSPDRNGSTQRADDTRDPARARHVERQRPFAHDVTPRCSRGTRGPTRVTIS